MRKWPWILAAGIMLMFAALNRNIYMNYTLSVILSGAGGVLTLLGVVLCLKARRVAAAAARAANERARLKRAADEMMRQEAARAAAAAREAEHAREAARQAEWDRTHGRIVTAIAGVTFNNDDGSSRQAILKDIKARGGDAEVELEEFEYKGKPAVRVLIDGEQIGNIPRSRVQDVLAAMDAGITHASLDVETFRPEDDEDEEGNVRRRGELIYRADLTLIYNK